MATAVLTLIEWPLLMAGAMPALRSQPAVSGKSASAETRKTAAQPPAQPPGRSSDGGRQCPQTVEEAYEHYIDAVWGTLRRLGVHPSLLEDAAQDVFMTAHRRWDDFRFASSRKTWLIGIALRTAANHRRRNARDAGRKSAEDVEGLGVDAGRATSSNAFEQVARRQASAFLQQFLDALPEGQRELFVLVDLEQLTVRESAEACGVSFSTGYKRLQLARGRFNEAVKRYQAADQRRLR